MHPVPCPCQPSPYARRQIVPVITKLFTGLFTVSRSARGLRDASRACSRVPSAAVDTKSRGSRPMVWRRSTPSRSLTLAHRPLLLCAGLESLVRCQSHSWMTVPSRCAQLPNSPWPAPIRARNPRPSSPQCVQHPALTTARRWPTVCRTSFMTVRPASVSGSPACVLTCRA